MEKDRAALDKEPVAARVGVVRDMAVWVAHRLPDQVAPAFVRNAGRESRISVEYRA